MSLGIWGALTDVVYARHLLHLGDHRIFLHFIQQQCILLNTANVSFFKPRLSISVFQHVSGMYAPVKQ